MKASSLRYDVDEALPRLLALGSGAQLAVLIINSVVLVAAIVFRAGGTDEFLLWGVFATVLCSGLSTILQALRVGRIGAGYVILSGTSDTQLAVCMTVVAEGGPAMLATLVVISSVIQLALSMRLSLLRRVLTPAVTGTMIMLLPVTVMPILFRMLKEMSPGDPAAAGPISALVTVVTIVGIGLKGTGRLRLWGPAIGVAAGSLAAGLFGIYDIGRVGEAAWIGLPEGRWPGLSLDFGPTFWSLLPPFILVTLLAATKSIGVAVATQRVSHRRPRTVDFRGVQGAMAAEGVGNLLAGFAGAAPSTPYSTGPTAIELTGVAARSAGIVAGAVFVVLAFVPKALAVVLAIPAPVVAVVIMLVMAMLFVLGMREVEQDGADYRTGLIVSVSFWVGTGCHTGLIFPAVLSEFAGGFLQNAITSGGLTVILLTLVTALTTQRRRRFLGHLDLAELPRINAFLSEFRSRNGWDAATARRLEAASEETLLTLLQAGSENDRDGGEKDCGRKRLFLTARKGDDDAVLEFVTTSTDDDINLQDRIAVLGERPVEGDIEHDVSFRLLRHISTSVRHQQFHNANIITVTVDVTGAAGGRGRS